MACQSRSSAEVDGTGNGNGEAVVVHEASFHCTDLGTQIKQAVEEFKNDEVKRTCGKCGTVADWAPKPGSIQDPNLE